MIGRQSSSGAGTSSGVTSSRKRGTTTTGSHASNSSPSSSEMSSEMEPLVVGHTSTTTTNSTSIPSVIMSSNSPMLNMAIPLASSTSSQLGSKDRSHPRRYTTIAAYLQSFLSSTTSIKFVVLVVLSLQNSLFTVLRRYSQGIRMEMYSKYEVLMMGEIIKLVFSSYMIHRAMTVDNNNNNSSSSNVHSDDPTNIASTRSLNARLLYLTHHSGKMVGLAIIYGIMNILSFVALRNIGAGTFTIFAQCKILTTAAFSALILNRHYSITKWRALIALVFGVLLFSEPIWNKPTTTTVEQERPMVVIGIVAVMIEVTLSGFASIYFEKVIKLDPLPLTIWERNYQLALGSIPVYICFILWDGGGSVGYFGGWSFIAWVVTVLGAAGGLLVALSIKYGDAILKTLATTAAIILSSLLDYYFLSGPLTPVMVIAGVQVIIAICNYTFDTTPEPKTMISSSNNINIVKSSDKDIELATSNNTDADK